MSTAGILALAVGIPVGVALILILVFFIIYRVGLTRRRRIAAEGVIQRSGTRWVRVVLRDYQGPLGRVRHRSGNNIGEVLLVPSGLYVVGGRLVFNPADLAHCTASCDGVRLRLATSKPPYGTGHVDVLVRVDDGPAWLEALRGVGVHVDPEFGDKVAP